MTQPPKKRKKDTLLQAWVGPKLAAKVEAHAVSHGLTKSETVRQALKNLVR